MGQVLDAEPLVEVVQVRLPARDARARPRRRSAWLDDGIANGLPSRYGRQRAISTARWVGVSASATCDVGRRPRLAVRSARRGRGRSAGSCRARIVSPSCSARSPCSRSPLTNVPLRERPWSPSTQCPPTRSSSQCSARPRDRRRRRSRSASSRPSVSRPVSGSVRTSLRRRPRGRPGTASGMLGVELGLQLGGGAAMHRCLDTQVSQVDTRGAQGRSPGCLKIAARRATVFRGRRHVLPAEDLPDPESSAGR